MRRLVKTAIELCSVWREQTNEQTYPQTNATVQHASRNFYFIKFWLAANASVYVKHNLLSGGNNCEMLPQSSAYYTKQTEQ